MVCLPLCATYHIIYWVFLLPIIPWNHTGHGVHYQLVNVQVRGRTYLHMGAFVIMERIC